MRYPAEHAEARRAAPRACKRADPLLRWRQAVPPRGSKGNAVQTAAVPATVDGEAARPMPLGSTREGEAQAARAVSQETCRRCRPSACRESAWCGNPSWRRLRNVGLDAALAALPPSSGLEL